MTMTAFPGVRHRLFVRNDLGLPAAASGADPLLWWPRSFQYKTLKLMAAFGAFEEYNGHSIPPVGGAGRNRRDRISTSSPPLTLA